MKRNLKLFLLLVLSVFLLSGFSECATLNSADLLKAKPKVAPARWAGLIGMYKAKSNELIVLEKLGSLYALTSNKNEYLLKEIDKNRFNISGSSKKVRFIRNNKDAATGCLVGDIYYKRELTGTEDGKTFKITPLKPVAVLKEEALKSSPPEEKRTFLKTYLIELVKIDPSLKLDIRYATSNNFMGTSFYDEPRAFLQKPAVQALVRVNRKLKKIGYGLMIFDAYRPWYVTKMFWDATPDNMKEFVANPAGGSRHNRGCAVDVTLVDLKTGKPLNMGGEYDEFTKRSYPDFKGGTSLERWGRLLLRAYMEEEGFAVYPTEWWHFDYKNWKEYPINNKKFEDI
jgi:D-alanyl-D-alanine dipeptidase